MKGSTAIDGFFGKVERSGQSPAIPSGRFGAVGLNSIGMHGSDDVFDFLFAQILELHLQLAANLAIDIARDADPARLGERLEPRRQIDAVAIEVAALDDHIAEIDADAQKDVLIGG